MHANYLKRFYYHHSHSAKTVMKQGALLFSLFTGLLFLFIQSTAYANPDIETWQTKNGARIYYVHAPELPMIDMRAVFDAGAARDGKKAGLGFLRQHL